MLAPLLVLALAAARPMPWEVETVWSGSRGETELTVPPGGDSCRWPVPWETYTLDLRQCAVASPPGDEFQLRMARDSPTGTVFWRAELMHAADGTPAGTCELARLAHDVWLECTDGTARAVTTPGPESWLNVTWRLGGEGGDGVLSLEVARHTVSLPLPRDTVVREALLGPAPAALYRVGSRSAALNGGLWTPACGRPLRALPSLHFEAASDPNFPSTGPRFSIRPDGYSAKIAVGYLLSRGCRAVP